MILTGLALLAAASCSKENEAIKVESISLDKESITMLNQGTSQLKINMLPENAEYELILWSSDNEAVATVDENGLVTAASTGTANIIADVDGFRDTCAVSVLSGNKLPDEARVGDFYLSDGSLLDKDTDEATVKSASVIGIVFTTDTARMGEAEKEALRAKGIEPHGLVLATLTPGNASDVFHWYVTPEFNSSRDESEIGLPKLWENFEEGIGKEKENYILVNNDIEGYKYNVAIRTERKEDYEAGHYGAIKAAADFENQVPTPATSTGWYLPSAGQWFDALRNLGGVILNENDSFLIDDYGNFSWVNRGRVPDEMNKCMVKVADDQKTEYAIEFNQVQYWTSSTVSHDQARVIMFDNASFVYSWWYKKFFQWSVRTVLGF